MARIEVRRSHTLGKDAAWKSAERIAQQLQNEMKGRYHREGDDLKFECPGAHGCIRVGENEVRVEVELSFLLRPLRGHIECEINEYLDQGLR
jgi:putative polyhydroxyalkanoate system protein